MSAQAQTSGDSRRIELDHEWAPYQAEVLHALESGEYDLVVLRTGYGGGKSILGARWLHRTALQYGGEYLAMATTFQEGEGTTYRVFFDELPGEHTVPNDAEGDPENSPIVAGYNDNKKRLTYVNGAVTRLGSADKWNRYAGAEFNGIWCDEPAHYQTDLYDLHEMLISRQRTEAGPNVTLWTSTGSGFNQYYDITERGVTPDDEPLGWADRMKVVVASALENPFLEEKEKLRAQFEGTPREDQALHGGFAAAQGLVYKQFSRENHVVPHKQVAELVPDSAEPIYGYDAGWDHPRVLVEWHPTHYDQWIATDCYYESERPFEHLCNPQTNSGWVYRKDKPRTTVYCEHEPEHIRKFNQAGFRALQADKDLDAGIPHVRGLLELKGDPKRPGLLVSDRCTELIQEFFSYKEEHVGKSGDVPDHCFVAGTMVLTETGERPIETIRPGDRVLTRDGYRPVLAAGKTKKNAEIVTAHLTNGRELAGTGDHPIHTRDGFKPLLSLRYSDLLTPRPRTVKGCQESTRSNTKESYFGATQSRTTSQTAGTTGRTASTLRMVSGRYTGRFGATTTAKSPGGTTSTTLTATPRTTTSRIWNASVLRSTPRGTQKTTSHPPPSKRGSRPRRNGTRPTKAANGIPNTGNSRWQTRSTRSKRNARCARGRSRTGRPTGRAGSAQTPAKRSGGETRASTMSKTPAVGAGRRSPTTSTRTDSSVRVSALRDTGTEADVYNLTVLGPPEYYANGVLVHNCLDATRYCLFTHGQNQGTGPKQVGSMRDLL